MGFPSAWAIFVQDWCRLRLRGFALVDDQENEGDGQQAVGHGAMFALGDNKAIMGQRNGDGSIRLYFALRTSEDPSRSQGDATVEVDVVRDQLRDTFSGWDPKLLALLDEVDGGFSYWPLYTMPVTQRWTAHHNLTLVGDAAHVMPLGPHIITADEVPDPNANPLEISTRVNGVYKQRTTTDTMIHSIPTLLEFLTQTVTLQPGDLMSSGTCGGTGMGREPQEFMHPGDTVTVGVSGVGYLTNSLEAGWEQPR